MTLIASLLLLTGLCFAQFPTTYNLNVAPESLAVKTIANPEFPWLLDGFHKRAGDPDLTPIAPLIVHIKNIGRKAIGYLNVRYTYTLPDGDHAGDVTYERNPHMGDQLRPGQEIVIHPAMDAVGHHVTAANVRMVDQLVDLMRRCSKIDVSIDAVTWEDGRIAGPDRGGIANKYRAQREAIAAAYAEAVGRTHQAPEDDLTFRRALKYAKGDADALKGMLDKFAPLKGDIQ